MADIKQAAKWMQVGKEINRKAWGESRVRLHVCNSFGKVMDDFERTADFTALELLADDWEICK